MHHHLRRGRLRCGVSLRLIDDGLKDRTYGFEAPWLFGVLEKCIRREPGYHIFLVLTPRVELTFKPWRGVTTTTQIAIPDYLVMNQHDFMRVETASIGQRVKDNRLGGPFAIQPPLRAWQEDNGWKHPMHKEIESWRHSRRRNLV